MGEDKRKRGFNKLIIVLIILLIIIDQVSKFCIINSNVVSEDKLSVHVIENVLDITYVENRGGAFGFGQNNTMTFIIVNLIVLGLIIRFMIVQKDMTDRRTNIALALILSGGISNLIDRIFRGFVFDFIDFSPLIRFPVFNIADILVVVGWILLVIFILMFQMKEKKPVKKVNIEEKR